jgi:crossover junction endodeoxyribonuclease RusA|tara:strand:- start:9166 stop:9561 length:396 start_codon:yes stop_codon:yes gene_type:complete
MIEMGENWLSAVLPWAPTVNHYYQKSRKGAFFLSQRGRRFRDDVSALLRPCSPLSGPLSLRVDLFPPDRRKRDIDNNLKALLDSLEKGGAFEDDNQITHLSVFKHEAKKPGRISIHLSCIKIPVKQEGDLG